MEPFEFAFNIYTAAWSAEKVEQASSLLKECSYRSIGLDGRIQLRATERGIECELYDFNWPRLSTPLEFEKALREAQEHLDASPLGPVVKDKVQVWSIVEQIGMTITAKWGPIERV